MKANLYDLQGNKIKEIVLPRQFDEEIREDIIKRAVLAVQSHNRQPYGPKSDAGKRASAALSRRRKSYKTAYGHGISRVPRKTMWHRGMQFGWVGAFAPGTRGGRAAHPPRPERIWGEKINKQERRKAIRSALAATVNPELIKLRGHKFENAPIIIDNKFENLKKTKDVEGVLIKLGLQKELDRISKKIIRAGKGKMRGRKYKIKKGPLIVISKSCPLEKSIINLQGIDICHVENLNAELLAPGTMIGRLTIYTEDSINKIEKEKLFTNEYKKKETKK